MQLLCNNATCDCFVACDGIYLRLVQLQASGLVTCVIITQITILAIKFSFLILVGTAAFETTVIIVRLFVFMNIDHCISYYIYVLIEYAYALLTPGLSIDDIIISNAKIVLHNILNVLTLILRSL